MKERFEGIGGATLIVLLLLLLPFISIYYFLFAGLYGVQVPAFTTLWLALTYFVIKNIYMTFQAPTSGIITLVGFIMAYFIAGRDLKDHFKNNKADKEKAKQIERDKHKYLETSFEEAETLARKQLQFNDTTVSRKDRDTVLEVVEYTDDTELVWSVLRYYAAIVKRLEELIENNKKQSN